MPMLRYSSCHSVSKTSSVTLGVRRILHVDAHEELVAAGRVEDAPQVVDAGGAVDVEAELGQLQRDVALDARRDDHVDEPHVLARGRGGFLDVLHALAEVVEREQHPRACSARAASIASSTVSPAMNRRAKPLGRHAVLRREPLERGAARRATRTALSSRGVPSISACGADGESSRWSSERA